MALRSNINLANNHIKIATISDSGSTNLPGWVITIYSDGSGNKHFMNSVFVPDVNYSSGTFSPTLITLNNIADVSKITEGLCAKSVSFGSVTTVTYRNKTSPNLQCIAQNGTKAQIDLYNELRILKII